MHTSFSNIIYCIILIGSIISYTGFTGLKAQSISKDIISSAGQYEKKGQVQIQWTLGEISISDHVNNSRIIEGFHSGFLLPSLTSVSNIPTLLLQLYPNPTSDFLNFDLPELQGKFSFSIYNLQGMKVMDGYKKTKSNINLNNLQAGFYLIKVENTKGHLFTGVFTKI